MNNSLYVSEYLNKEENLLFGNNIKKKQTYFSQENLVCP